MDLRPYLRRIPLKLRWPNWSDPKTTLFRAYTIYAIQQSKIGTRQSHSPTRSQIWTLQNTMTLIHRASKGRLMDIFEQLFIQKYSHEQVSIQEQTPGENNPLFILLYAVQLRHTDRTGSCLFADTPVILLLRCTIHTTH